MEIAFLAIEMYVVRKSNLQPSFKKKDKKARCRFKTVKI